jgi:hypothetical protein
MDVRDSRANEQHFVFVQMPMICDFGPDRHILSAKPKI